MEDFDFYDKQYGRYNAYARKISKRKDIGHMSNEKVCFHQLVPYELNAYLEKECDSADGLFGSFVLCRFVFVFPRKQTKYALHMP